MTTTLSPIITAAGLSAVFNAQHNGFEAQITHIALGDLGWQPDVTATALRQERQRITASGEKVSTTQLHITGVDSGDQEYWVRELGFYLADGTLLAIWSSDTQPLAYKSAAVDLLLALDLTLSALPADSVTINMTSGFDLPLATQSKRGILRFATQLEANTREATDLALAPATLPTATQSRQGVMRFATQAEINAGTATQAAVTPAQLASYQTEASILAALLSHDGQGSGVDADLIRGMPGDFSHSHHTAGYQKLPSGLIIQWGVFNGIFQDEIPFSQAFPTVCYIVIGTIYHIHNITREGFRAANQPHDSGGVSYDANFCWLALGK